ncbi:hypothetical protein [Rhodoblastus sp.]|uniref:hypothetical protein n=1 Tax=Rhodoblastus sp. TaxID=1962975 RepID=UPI003F9549AE
MIGQQNDLDPRPPGRNGFDQIKFVFFHAQVDQYGREIVGAFQIFDGVGGRFNGKGLKAKAIESRDHKGGILRFVLNHERQGHFRTAFKPKGPWNINKTARRADRPLSFANCFEDFVNRERMRLP